jgi:hypothetical protein
MLIILNIYYVKIKYKILMLFLLLYIFVDNNYENNMQLITYT